MKQGKRCQKCGKWKKDGRLCFSPVEYDPFAEPNPRVFCVNPDQRFADGFE